MIDEHELIMEDVAALALGVLDGDAQARVEEHLQSCVDCRQLLTEYRAAAGLLPFGATLDQPSAGAWDAIQSRLRATPAADATPAVLRPRPARWYARPGLMLATGSLAAASLIIGIVLLAQAIGGAQTNQSQTARKATQNNAAANFAAAAGTVTSARAAASAAVQPAAAGSSQGSGAAAVNSATTAAAAAAATAGLTSAASQAATAKAASPATPQPAPTSLPRSLGVGQSATPVTPGTSSSGGDTTRVLVGALLVTAALLLVGGLVVARRVRR